MPDLYGLESLDLIGTYQRTLSCGEKSSMLRIWENSRSRNCTGLSRRNFLQVGGLAAGGLALSDLLRNESQANPAASRSNKSVILYWLDGGPTHMETYDPKPDAPAEYRGPLGVTKTSVPGIQLSELLVEQAKVMDKFSVLRSVHHRNGDHFAAAHWMLTGYLGSTAAMRDPQYPSAGSIITKTCGSKNPYLPAYVAVPYSRTVGIGPGYNSGTYLGATYNPFETTGNPNDKNFKVRNLTLSKDVTVDRLGNRRNLLTGLDRLRRDVDGSGAINGIDRFNAEALEMVTGEAARKAFDINAEDPKVRDRYGRNTYGQSALLARRLVESGVRFVTIHNGGWDHHSRIEAGMKSRLPSMDRSLGALVEDLHQRGMLEDTMVCVMGEFGRTPRINANAGRDHWGNVMSVMLGGGGLKGGQAVGASNSKGEVPADQPLAPADVLTTIYHQMGINLETMFENHSGRPVGITNGGKPIRQLI